MKNLITISRIIKNYNQLSEKYLYQIDPSFISTIYDISISVFCSSYRMRKILDLCEGNNGSVFLQKNNIKHGPDPERWKWIIVFIIGKMKTYFYVDDEIAKIPIDDRPQGMPGTRYKYSNSYDNSLPDGCFHITGGGEVQMSRKSFDGIEMSSYGTDDFTSSVRNHCHVRGADGRVLHSLVFSHYYQGQGTNQRIVLNVSTRVRNGKADMVPGTIYYITDGIFNF